MTTWDDLLKPGNANDFFTGNFPPFEPDAKTYSRANAMWLAELCRLVYRDGDVTKILAKGGLELVGERFNDKNTQAFLVRAPNIFAALVFRGTDDLKAWITDLQAWQKPLGNGVAIHEGFEDALDNIWKKIEPALHTVEPLFFSGHSLGAALATIAASRKTPRALYTFGSPFVGNRAFVDSLPRIPIFRVDDAHDIVPTVPPEDLGYTHAGEVQMLHVKKESPHPVHSWFDPPPFLADHAPINYVTRI